MFFHQYIIQLCQHYERASLLAPLVVWQYLIWIITIFIEKHINPIKMVFIQIRYLLN